MTNWTDEQLKTIQYDMPADLLVSAAAGSGKTSVLTERIVRRALSGKIRLPRLLVMTFTDLAAQQMKQRIAKRFRKELKNAKTPEERKHVETLLRELPLARISTIHAFCNDILSSNLDRFCGPDGRPLVEPGYRVADEKEIMDLMEKSMDAVLSSLNTKLNSVIRSDKEHPVIAEKTRDTEDTKISNMAEMPDNSVSAQSLGGFVSRDIPLSRNGHEPFILAGPDRTLADWLRDYRAISLTFSPGLTEDDYRFALSSMLDQLRNLPAYEQKAAEALEQLFLNAENFPDCEMAEFWWTRFEETCAKASEALSDLSETPYYAMFETKECSKNRSITKLRDSTRTMEKIIKELPVRGDQSAERWDRIVRIGDSFENLEFPNYAHKITKESQLEQNLYLDRFRKDILPLAGLISNRLKRTPTIESYLKESPPVFTETAEKIRNKLLGSAHFAARFLETALLIDHEFRKRRFEQNTILFNDIEHGALDILSQEDIREQYRIFFDEIYVDEFQDTSSIQDAILKTIARGNVFMVGDVKQSIYRFRYANPAIFETKKEASRAIPDTGDLPESADTDPDFPGYLVLLNRNFRSLPGILNFINDFFSAFLTREAGEIEYDETQKLIPDREYTGDDTPSVVLSVAVIHDKEENKVSDNAVISEKTPVDQKESEIPCGTGGQSSDLPKEGSQSSAFSDRMRTGTLLPEDTAEREAFLAADIIQKLLAEGKPAETIAVLLPTNDKCLTFQKILEQCKIPVATRSGPFFPDNMVTRQAEALLSVIDNPLQDVPLINTLLGPFAPEPFTGEELLTIAGSHAYPFCRQFMDAADRRRSTNSRINSAYYDKADLFPDTGYKNEHSGSGIDPAFCDKAGRFLDSLNRWRLIAKELPARQLLDIIFNECDYETYISSLPESGHWMTDLELLRTLLDGDNPARAPGLREAIKLIENARRTGRISDKTDSAMPDGFVRVLTRHSSKGLEWDYVILGDLSHSGNNKINNIAFSEQDGLSCCTIEDDGLAVYNNLFRERAIRKEKRRSQAELWRLLYVAMTRAKNRLFLLLPLEKTSKGNLKVSKSVDQAAKIALDMSIDERKERALIPSSLSSTANSDADILLTVLAARNPDLTMALLEAGTYVDEDKQAAFEFDYLTAYVRPWMSIAKDVLLRTEESDETIECQDPPVSEITAPERSAPEMPVSGSTESKEEIKILLTAPLPHPKAAFTPAKLTVTEIKRLVDTLPERIDKEDGDAGEQPLSYEAFLSEKNGTPTPRDMALTMRRKESKSKLTGTQLGTVMHTVFQFLDIRKVRNSNETAAESAYSEQLDAMWKRGLLDDKTRAAAAAFTKSAIKWSKSALAGRILSVEESSGKIYREMPFTLAVPSNNISTDWPPNETTLVQGMIDLWFVEDGNKAVLIDFKTDRLPENDADDELRKRYQVQIDMYAKAIEQATGMTVRERLIWLIRDGRAIRL